jgi:hypothetical protein
MRVLEMKKTNYKDYIDVGTLKSILVECVNELYKNDYFLI